MEEEAKYFYYSNLAKYSLTNSFILIILIIIEMYPILIDFMESPFILFNARLAQPAACEIF